MAHRVAWRVVAEAQFEKKKLTYILCSKMQRYQNLFSNNVKDIENLERVVGLVVGESVKGLVVLAQYCSNFNISILCKKNGDLV